MSHRLKLTLFVLAFNVIGMHKNVSEATLVNLSKSPDEYVLSAVAANPKTPLSIIREVSEKATISPTGASRGQS